MLVEVLLAASGLLMGAQALPAPNAVAQPDPSGIIILGPPKSTIIWGSKREAEAEPEPEPQIQLGPVGSTTTFPGSNPGTVVVTPREPEAKKPNGIVVSLPHGIISLGPPKSTLIIGSKREAKPDGITQEYPSGIIILGPPKSTTIWGSKREAEAEPEPQIELGPVDSETTTPGSEPGTVIITGRDPKPDGITQEYPSGIIILGPPKSTTIWGSKREAEPEPQIELGPVGSTTTIPGSNPGTVVISGRDPKPDGVTQEYPSGIIILGPPKSTTIWGSKREAEAEPEPQIELGPVGSTTTFPGSSPGTVVVTPREAEAAPQIGLPSPSACKCAPKSAVGKYCGSCKQITGSWVSWNQYQCKADGSCADLGFNKVCVDGSSKQCPGK